MGAEHLRRGVAGMGLWALSVMAAVGAEGPQHPHHPHHPHHPQHAQHACKGQWGFFAHRRINYQAVFTLPGGMLPFYKHHLVYLTEAAVEPDRRRSQDPDEAPRHYIDLDAYGPRALALMPRRWEDAVAAYTEDTLRRYGIVPWHLERTARALAAAFARHDRAAVLHLSADLGHYAADLNVPLHTTLNYDGQLTGQRGLHALWESRLPELFYDSYDLLTGPAAAPADLSGLIWAHLTATHTALDSVLSIEAALAARHGDEIRHTVEAGQRAGAGRRTFREAYARRYHAALGGMVERRMRASISLVGSLWLWAWREAGAPDLSTWIADGPPPPPPPLPVPQAPPAGRPEPNE